MVAVLDVVGGRVERLGSFNSDARYSRKDVFCILGIDGPKVGSWHAGYTSHGDDCFIFCGAGTADRTGRDYQNRFVGA